MSILGGDESQRRVEEEKLRERILRKRYLRLFLTPDARERLSNIKMVRPEIAEQVENYVLQLGLSGKLSRPLTDEQLKELLSKFASKQREIRFKFL